MLTPVVTAARAELRARWRAWLLLAVLSAIAGGAVLTAAAGARRTDTAYSRLARAEHAPDILVLNSTDPTFASVSPSAVARLPEVKELGTVSAYKVARPTDMELAAPTDTRVGRSLWGRRIVHGHDVDPASPDEAVVGFTTASAHNLHPGDRVNITAVSVNNTPVNVSLRVVGIEAAPGEFPPQSGTGIHAVWTTPAFARANDARLAHYAASVVVLRRGEHSVPAFMRGVQLVTGGKPIQSFNTHIQAVNTQRSIHLQAVALWLLAALLAVAGALTLGQLLVRQTVLASEPVRDLGALGMTRGQLWLVVMAPPVLVGAVGALGALVLATALSPLSPIGLARTAEPHPGFSFDAVALLGGTTGIVAIVILLAAWPAWRYASPARARRRADARLRSSALLRAVSGSGVPVTVATGVRLGFQRGRGRTSLPVRTTLVGAAIGVAALVAAGAFESSLLHLLSTPKLYGVTWDARVTNVVNTDVRPTVNAVLADHDVTDVSIGYSGYPLQLDDVSVEGIAVTSVRGSSLMPRAISGRLPRQPGEVMLGKRTLESLHRHIGDTVPASLAGAAPNPLPLRIVGVGVFPTLSDALELGRGAAMVQTGMKEFVPSGQLPPYDTLLVRFRDGVNHTRAVAALDKRVGALGTYEAFAPTKPGDLANFSRVQNLPSVLGGLLALFALATLTHLLITSIRRRRRDLAVLKVLGFAPAQVRQAVAWQSTSLSVVALIVGIPVGALVGRWVWNVFATQLGVLAGATMPWTLLIVLVPATVALANAVAFVPGRLAAHIQPARALTAE